MNPASTSALESQEVARTRSDRTCVGVLMGMKATEEIVQVRKSPLGGH